MKRKDRYSNSWRPEPVGYMHWNINSNACKEQKTATIRRLLSCIHKDSLTELFRMVPVSVLLSAEQIKKLAYAAEGGMVWISAYLEPTVKNEYDYGGPIRVQPGKASLDLSLMDDYGTALFKKKVETPKPRPKKAPVSAKEIQQRYKKS